MLRRWSLGLALSVALHVAVVGGIVGWALLRDAVPRAVDIDVTNMRLDELADLPLGAPAAGDRSARARARAQAPATTEKEGTLASSDEPAPPRAGQGDDEEEEDAAGPRVSNLRELGPEGSRFTLLLRLDRLKGTAFADPVDALLARMPDRRDLLEGTGLSLYDDFDALLVSTPNPLDYTMTFLAARHHLSDAAMRASVDRGARATGRVISWRLEGRRPWGERRARGPAAASAATRDGRIIVLPATGLVVVTPPAYRALLLARPRRAAGADGGTGDQSAPAAGGDSGAGGAGAEAPPAPNWSALLRRIGAEDGLLGPNDVAMVTAVDLIRRGQLNHTSLLGVEVPMPRVVSAVLGKDPDPFLAISGEFEEEGEARRWETAWPALQRKLRTNPYLVLGGFASIAGRMTLTRDENTVHVRVSATADETVRLLQMAASALGGR